MDINTPNFHITIDPSSSETLRKGCLSVIVKVCPSWNLNEVQLKTFTDGLTNKLVGGWCGDKEEMVLVRVYGANTEKYIDRVQELVNIKRMSIECNGSKLYGTFLNGMAYQFIPGQILELDLVKQPEVYRKVARAMASMHKVKLGENERTVTIWSLMQKLIDFYPANFQDSQKQEQFSSSFPTQEQLKEEMKNLKLSLGDIKSPIVLCHNDPMPANMVLRGVKDEGFPADRVTLIDLEYAGPNYQALDISNVFNEYVAPGQDYDRDYPSQELIKDWIAEYLTHFHCQAPTQVAIEDLYKVVVLFTPCGHLFWAIWAVLQAATSNIDFDYLGYAKTRMDQYNLLRKNI